MAQGLILFLILFPMAAAPVVFPMRHRGRSYRDRFIQWVPLVELAAGLALLACPAVELSLPGVCGLGLHFSAGSLGRLLAVVAALLWAGTGAVSPPYFASAEGCNRYYFFWLLTLGALMGVFLSADLFTLFVFFEMMSFTSYVWVAQNETPEALRAGQTYLAVAAEVFSILTSKPEISPVFTAVGAVIGLAGVALFATAVVTMRDSWRAGIAVSERTELVTGGVFQISRNPAFLAFDCVYLGLLLMFFNPLLLLCSLFAAVMLHLQILQEESYLADVFGDSYLAYKSCVRRYLGRKRPCSPCGGIRGTR